MALRPANRTVRRPWRPDGIDFFFSQYDRSDEYCRHIWRRGDIACCILGGRRARASFAWSRLPSYGRREWLAFLFGGTLTIGCISMIFGTFSCRTPSPGSGTPHAWPSGFGSRQRGSRSLVRAVLAAALAFAGFRTGPGRALPMGPPLGTVRECANLHITVVAIF
jgi:hypothetical protein